MPRLVEQWIAATARLAGTVLGHGPPVRDERSAHLSGGANSSAPLSWPQFYDPVSHAPECDAVEGAWSLLERLMVDRQAPKPQNQ